MLFGYLLSIKSTHVARNLLPAGVAVVLQELLYIERRLCRALL